MTWFIGAQVNMCFHSLALCFLYTQTDLFCLRSSTLSWLNSGLSQGSSAQQRCISWPSSSLCIWELAVGRRYGHSPRATRSMISVEEQRDKQERLRDTWGATCCVPHQVYTLIKALVPVRTQVWVWLEIISQLHASSLSHSSRTPFPSKEGGKDESLKNEK